MRRRRRRSSASRSNCFAIVPTCSAPILRITNFGGGNTSSKFDLIDPVSGKPARVLAVKGSGGDLRSMGTAGFALLYLDKLEQLIDRYRGEAHEDEMVGYYPLCAFGDNRVAASIDTTLHAFLPFDHVDHLHPDWAIALAASANGDQKIEEFNRRYGRRIIWVPWQRPGLRAGADAAARRRGGAGCRRPDSRQPRVVHLGRDAARVLSQQPADHRADGRVHPRSPAAQRPAALRRRRRGPARRRSRCDRGGDPAVSARRGVVEPARGRPREHVARSADLRQFGVGRRSVPDGHELPGSLSADADLADVRRLGSGARESRDAEVAHPRARRAVPPRLRRVLLDLRRPGVAGAARIGSRRSS